MDGHRGQAGGHDTVMTVIAPPPPPLSGLAGGAARRPSSLPLQSNVAPPTIETMSSIRRRLPRLLSVSLPGSTEAQRQ